MLSKTAFVVVISFCVRQVNSNPLWAFYDWFIGSTNPNDLHAGNRLRNRLNILRQPAEFTIDIAFPFDVSNFGTGALAHVPILTSIVGLAAFFLLLGILATPFVALAEYKTKKWVKRSVERGFNETEKNANFEAFDEDGHRFGDSFFARFKRGYDRGLDLDNGFTFLGLSSSKNEKEFEETMACRKFVLCEMHRYLNIVPEWALEVVKFVGKRMRNMAAYKDAVQAGLDLLDCEEIFHDCPKDLGQIVATLPIKILPKRRR